MCGVRHSFRDGPVEISPTETGTVVVVVGAVVVVVGAVVVVVVDDVVVVVVSSDGADDGVVEVVGDAVGFRPNEKLGSGSTVTTNAATVAETSDIIATRLSKTGSLFIRRRRCLAIIPVN